MKKIILFISIGLIGLSQQVVALDFSFNSSISKLSGQTEYELNVAFKDSLIGYPLVDRKIRSLLEFPLNSTIGTFGIAINNRGDSTKKWVISLDVSRNFNDPTKVMKDSDWDEISGFFPMTQFSYTESIPTMKFTEFHFKSQFQFTKNTNSYLYILIGMKYQEIQQSIDNFTGWYRPGDPNTITYLPPVTIDSVVDTPALYYKVKYKTPYIGLGLKKKFGNSTSLDFSASYSLVMSSDFDDHLLRFKTSESRGNGSGYFLSGKGKILIMKIGNSKKIFFEPTFEYAKYEIKTLQTQVWYGNDPATGSFDDTGGFVGKIPLAIRSNQTKIGLNIQLTF